MNVVSRADAFAVAHELIARSPAVETEVTLDSFAERWVRFAPMGATQNADRERVDVAVRVRVARGGQLAEARAETTSLEPAALESALERALALAGASPSESALVELGGAVACEPTRADPATGRHAFADKASWIERALDEARAAKLEPAGLAQTLVGSRAIVNSRGREVFGETSRASFALTVSKGSRSGFADQVARRVDELDVESVIARAIEKARAADEPRALAPGTYEVVLEPHAVSALFLFMAYEGFSARAFEERTSFVCGRESQRAFHENLTIVDDAGDPRLGGYAFDGEGTPRERVVLVDRGRVGALVSDRALAGRTGGRSTGHALPQPSGLGPMAQHLIVAAGDSSFESLVRSVERGLLVSQLHYVNSIEPRALELTGVTRHGLFWIENGAVRHAVRNLRFTDSLVRVLADVRGVGSSASVAGALFEGEVLTPALHLGSLRFSSATNF